MEPKTFQSIQQPPETDQDYPNGVTFQKPPEKLNLITTAVHMSIKDEKKDPEPAREATLSVLSRDTLP